MTGEITEELRFLQELVRQIGPAVYNVYLLRRLRLRAGALERARFARELHDGAVQSLIAVEMQVDVLRRQSATRAEVVPEELGRIQGLLREEVLKLRELMQQMKSLDVDSRKLIGISGGYSGKISARNRDHGALLLRSGGAGHAAAGVPRVDPHRAGRAGQRPQAQPGAARALVRLSAQKWPLDAGD